MNPPTLKEASMLNPDGEIGEALIFKYLTDLGYKCFSAPSKYFPDYDIKAVKPDGSEVLFEVKLDRIGLRTNTKKYYNLYIECFNTKKMYPSGIFNSKSDYYAYIFRTKVDDFIAYIFDTRNLRNYLCESDLKIAPNNKTGEKNAVGWLLPINSLTSNNMSYKIEYFDKDGKCRKKRAEEQ